jgi:Phage protein Gp138 N-terminal domain
MSDTSGSSGSGNGNSGTQGVYGQFGLSDDATHFHWLHFNIRQALSLVRTAFPVVIQKVIGGGVGPPPVVHVQPTVKQMDGVGNASNHDTVYNRPVMRIQGGKNAIICDPQVGDTFHMAVCDRDISSVASNNGAVANPGSYRRHHMSDGIVQGYTMGSNGKQITPNNYVDINGHVHILSASDVTITDSKGNTIIMNSTGLFVSPGSGLTLYLGAITPSGCQPVQTTGGPSANVYAFV